MYIAGIVIGTLAAVFHLFCQRAMASPGTAQETNSS
jgi:hypothetical protein